MSKIANSKSNLVAPVARDAFPTVDEVLSDPNHPMYGMFIEALAQARAEGAASVKVKAAPVRTAGAALAKAEGAFREDHAAAWSLVHTYGAKVITGGAKRRPEDYRAACSVLFGSADADPTQTALWRVIAKRDGVETAWATTVNGQGWDAMGVPFILALIDK